MSSNTLRDLVATRRVIVTVGSGGVGKTTCAAALALAGAQMGRRVLCLTIDPAHRLATSLGLKTMRSEAQPIDPSVLGAGSKGSLVAMMLDVRATFDELVARYAPHEEVRQRIYKNKIYQEIAGSLAGTPEYMAMEKLFELKSDPAYDLIVLDTPPTSNALDFLEAPERMVGAIDSPAIRAFVSAFQGAGRFSLNILSKAMAKILSGLSKFTGGGFLEQIAEFLSDIQSLFGGFKERANKVREEFRNADTGFVIVTSPDPMAIGEAIFFHEKLIDGRMKVEGAVVNRIRWVAPMEPISVPRVASVLKDAGVEPSMQLAQASLRAWQEGSALTRRDAMEVVRLQRELAGIPRFVAIPSFDDDVYDLAALRRVSALLTPEN